DRGGAVGFAAVARNRIAVVTRLTARLVDCPVAALRTRGVHFRLELLRLDGSVEGVASGEDLPVQDDGPVEAVARGPFRDHGRDALAVDLHSLRSDRRADLVERDRAAEEHAAGLPRDRGAGDEEATRFARSGARALGGSAACGGEDDEQSDERTKRVGHGAIL